MRALIFVLCLGSLPAWSVSAPQDQCDETCNEFMWEVWRGFEANPYPPKMTPAVYSGECNHLTWMYNPDTIHYSVLMIDDLNGKPYFSTIFAFFYEKNEWADWDLEKARQEMHGDWKNLGGLEVTEDHARVVVKNDDGIPVIVYWMRQNPVTKDIYYITHFDGQMTSFCMMKPNPQ